MIAGAGYHSGPAYDWRTNENKLGNSRGGYLEVSVKRNYTGAPHGLKTALWLDSPGPDLKYYLQGGTSLKEYGDNMKKVRIYFKNMGNAPVVIDDITITKRK